MVLGPIDILDENSWILQIPEAERTLAANAAMYFGHLFMEQSKQNFNHVEHSKVDMTAEQREAFSRLEGLLRMAVPTMIQQQQNSSIKGKRGENSLDELLAQHFGGRSKITDCSSLAHSGDRMIGSDILIEYKDYSSTVPTKEIDKFLRDMQESSTRVGILCSFNSKFARHADGRPSFINSGDKVVVLLPNCGHDGDKLVVAIEWALWFVSQTRDSKDDTLNETLLKISKDIVGDVDSLARELSQCSEHMKKEIQRLDSARNHALNALKIRLDVLSNINRG
jgi:hypothetical protein